MIYNEDDINFLNLTDNQFEELCYELLAKMGYKNLIWRQGGADSGRDIEGYLAVENSLVGSRDEKRFFECKRYESGVPAEQLNSKIAWADAEKPKHLVFLVSSYISNNTRTWLDKISDGKMYSIQVVEGKQLKQIILAYPDIIPRYFSNPFAKLLLEAQSNWLEHGVLPSHDMLSVFASNLDPTKLALSELGLICCSPSKDDNNSGYLDGFLHRLEQLANSSDSLMSSEYDTGSVHVSIREGRAVALRFIRSLPRGEMYGLICTNKEAGIEILVEAKGGFPTKVRYIPDSMADEMQHLWEIVFTRGNG